MPVGGDIAISSAEGAVAAPPRDRLLYLGTDRDAVTLSSNTGGTVLLLGGEPFAEDLVMWWNFVGRDHAEIEQARLDWESRSARFGEVPGQAERVPAPPLPHVRLRPRRRRL